MAQTNHGNVRSVVLINTIPAYEADVVYPAGKQMNVVTVSIRSFGSHTMETLCCRIVSVPLCHQIVHRPVQGQV